MVSRNNLIFIINILIIFAVVFSVAWIPWLGYEEYNNAGMRSTRVFAYLLFGVGLLTLFHSSKFSTVIYAVFIFFLLLITGVGWLYFDFYQAYLDITAISLIGETASDATKALGSLDSVALLFWFLPVIFLLACLMLVRKRTLTLLQKGFLVLLISYSIFAAYEQSEKRISKYSYIEKYVPAGNHPVGYFLMSFFSSSAPKVKTEHLKAFDFFNFPVYNRKYPLLNKITGEGKHEGKNILIVVLESFRSLETGIHQPNYSFTPNLDEIAKNNTVSLNHFANSTQTIRGELSILCGLLDNSGSSPVSSSASELIGGDCLPEILGKHGYRTLWFHGNESEFFSRNYFHPSLGFAELYDRDEILAEASESEELIGWGLSDRQVFRFALNKLEAIHDTGQPFFAEIMTLSNHYPFDWSWPEEIEELDFEVSENQVYENYLKGITYTDREIGRFWKNFLNSPLKDDTIVLFTGDHGIWLFNEQEGGFTEAVHPKGIYFRSPLVIYTPDKKRPDVDKISSQVDIPPTILDLLGISGEFAFFGRSMFAEGDGFVLANQYGMPTVITSDYACTVSEESLESDGRFKSRQEDESFFCVPVVKSEDNIVRPDLEKRHSLDFDKIFYHAKQIIDYFDNGHIVGFKDASSADR